MFEIEINDSGMMVFLNRISERTKNLSYAMKLIKEQMLASIEQNFLVGGRYGSGPFEGGSNRWKKLSSRTIERRKKKGHWPGQILVDSGRLAKSIGAVATNDSVVISTSLPYAAIHQFGGKAGKNHKAYIPARPFLVIQKEDKDKITQIISEWITAKNR